MFHIVLVEPEIPQNTGNIARTCACTGSTLHLVRPLGFAIDDRKLKRAGLDYWHALDIRYYDSLDDFLTQHKDDELFFMTTKGKHIHSDIAYPDNAYLVFGKETAGGAAFSASRAVLPHSDGRQSALAQSVQFGRYRGIRSPASARLSQSENGGQASL